MNDLIATAFAALVAFTGGPMATGFTVEMNVEAVVVVVTPEGFTVPCVTTNFITHTCPARGPAIFIFQPGPGGSALIPLTDLEPGWRTTYAVDF